MKLNTLDDRRLRVAIAGLVRGYRNTSDYSLLISRTRALKRFISGEGRTALEINLILFHEGNISAEHQEYILSQTGMSLKFINVESDFIFNNGEVVTQDPRVFSTRMSQSFPLGYKMMCRFWFSGFMTHLGDFDWVMRVDEDCEIVDGRLHQVLDDCMSQDVPYYCPMWINGDHEDVTVGLDVIVNEFRGAHGMSPRVGELAVPLTCVSLINIKRFAMSHLLVDFRDLILKKQGIMINRWGDAPLWGYMLELEKLNSTSAKIMPLAYKHGSHYSFVNFHPNLVQKCFMLFRRRRDRIKIKLRKFFPTSKA